MASIKQTPSGEFQLCAKNKLLPTILRQPSIGDAAEQLERLLRQGIVPTSLFEQAPSNRTPGQSAAALSST